MDPEITVKLTEADARINTITTNPSIDSSTARSIQDRRSRVDSMINDYKRRMNSLKSDILRELDTLNKMMDRAQ